MEPTSQPMLPSTDSPDVNVIVQQYADRVLVLITQLGKIGHMIQASIPETSPLPPLRESSKEPLPEPPASIQLTALLGSAPDEHHQVLHSIYATHSATLVWTSLLEAHAAVARRPVILGIALRKPKSRADDAGHEEEKQTFDAIMNKLWTILRET